MNLLSPFYKNIHEGPADYASHLVYVPGCTGVSFIDTQVISRIVRASVIPITLIQGVLSLLEGVINLTCVGLTLGRVKKLNIETIEQLLLDTELLLARPYFHLLKMINPRAEISTHLEKQEVDPFEPYHSLLSRKDPFTRYFGTRIMMLALTVFYTLQHLFDLALGILCAGASICLLGCNKRLNSFAYKNLKSCDLIGVISACAVILINPFAFQKTS